MICCHQKTVDLSYTIPRQALVFCEYNPSKIVDYNYRNYNTKVEVACWAWGMVELAAIDGMGEISLI